MPVAVDPIKQVEAMERRLREERLQSEQKLHEATASAKQTVNQKMLEIQGEVKRATDLARAAGAAASSTDDIRRNRGTQQWDEQLGAELRMAKEAAATAQSQVATMQSEKKEFFEQSLANELERARRKKRSDGLTASSSTSGGAPPPPPPAGAGSKVKKEKKTVKFSDEAPVVLPINNPAQNTPSNQPTGASVPGPRGAVMANTGASMPANPAPVTNNTREDDKPLEKSMREGASPAVRKKTKENLAVNKEKKRQAKVKAKQKQETEERNATAPLGERADEVKKQASASTKARAQAKAI